MSGFPGRQDANAPGDCPRLVLQRSVKFFATGSSASLVWSRNFSDWGKKKKTGTDNFTSIFEITKLDISSIELHSYSPVAAWR